jgi:hypothetical protein
MARPAFTSQTCYGGHRWRTSPQASGRSGSFSASPLPYQSPAGSNVHRLPARGILGASFGHLGAFRPTSLPHAAPAAAVCACSVVAAGCGRLAPRQAVTPSSGGQPIGQPDCGRQRRGSAPHAGVSLVEAAGPRPRLLSFWRYRRADRRPSSPMAMQNGRLPAGQSMLITRPRTGHRVISQVGCLRETRSDHPDQLVEANLAAPVWTPVRDRWRRRRASRGRSWFLGLAARWSHVAGPQSLRRSPA